MNKDFAGRVAIVTGAGAGLGRSHALGLAAEGARVALFDLTAPNTVAEEIRAAGGEALALACDVADMAAVERGVAQVMDAWGRVDVLVNNAGILRDKTFAKLTPADFALVLAVHLTGSFHCTRAVWEIMRAQGYGRIVLTSSASGIYGNFGQSNYGAAKAAMIGLMNVLHLEGAKYDIRVNTLAPTAATGMTEGLITAEEAALLAPETVTPGVLYLTHEDAPSRVILGAGAGVFAVTHIAETEGAWLPPAERTARGIAAAMDRIADRQGEVTHGSALDQTRKFVEIARKAGA
ncbi:NAD(P)-dependent dehydrogenase (short-subunit alcohol dehydrogenase family) [Aquamicrobium lusatiense]|uniref:NAD(P)-dependent dehydrogenase (Short-subunit alcohol dehydrogenase family) n=1 Tax=Aquamicrobium lusatiense TaxID=89772 RepID=A0A7W9S6B5_9HYPH|nr:SDR family NAD(P)-dependent oxidoreductase [Aquamicrobium lusatiense]MBB6014574.1 NAD(P)-dependent dehydrogenase (short-subunit alcohol dehydrogenase family) [Aquamicrobium lusatiense]